MKSLEYVLHFDIEDLCPNPKSLAAQQQLTKIFKEISDNTGIESLTFKSSWLTAVELSQIAKIISEHSNLRILDLSFNSIDVKAVSELKHIIIAHPKLEYIYLQGNQIDDKLIELLTVENSPSFKERLALLKKVDFSKNALSIKGLEMISNHFSPESALTVYVGNNIHCPKREDKILTSLKAKK